MTPRSLWRRHRALATLVAVVVLAGVVIAVLSQTTSGEPLDPRSATPEGSRALATLATDHGVEVDHVTTLAQARSAADGDATLLVARPARLASDQLDALAEINVEHLVVLEPQEPVVSALTTGVAVSDASPSGVRAPDCELLAAERAGAIRTDGVTYHPRDSGSGPAGAPAGAPAFVPASSPDVSTGNDQHGTISCYADGEHATLLRWNGPVPGTQRTRTVDLLGSSHPLTNDQLDEQGHAALALNLLGQHDRLVWYLPGPDDRSRQDQPTGITSLLPSGALFGAAQLAVATGLLMIVYARRLGPLVTERLPVVVHASETMEGRARLYRRFRARGPTADALRTATRSRLRPLLGLAPGTDVDTLVAAIAAHTGRGLSAVHVLIVDDPPRGDAELVRLVDHLDALEQEVRHS